MQNPGAVECGEAVTPLPDENQPSDAKLLDSPTPRDEIPEKGSGSVSERELYSSGVEKSPPKSTELPELELVGRDDSRSDEYRPDDVLSRHDSKDSCEVGSSAKVGEREYSDSGEPYCSWGHRRSPYRKNCWWHSRCIARYSSFEMPSNSMA